MPGGYKHRIHERRATTEAERREDLRRWRARRASFHCNPFRDTPDPGCPGADPFNIWPEIHVAADGDGAQARGRGEIRGEARELTPDKTNEIR